jgi:hypothetical protein
MMPRIRAELKAAQAPARLLASQFGINIKTLAKANGTPLQADPTRSQRFARAALQAMTVPTDAMVDAAHAAASFDDAWAINSRTDFRRAVRAMIAQAITDTNRWNLRLIGWACTSCPRQAVSRFPTVAASKVVGGGMRRHDVDGRPVRQWLARLA